MSIIQEYKIRLTPVTPMAEIQAKLTAFKTLYGDKVEVGVMGRTICDVKGEYIFATLRPCTVTKIGKQYLTVIADNEPCKVNVKNPNHGIEWLYFTARS